MLELSSYSEESDTSTMVFGRDPISLGKVRHPHLEWVHLTAGNWSVYASQASLTVSIISNYLTCSGVTLVAQGMFVPCKLVNVTNQALPLSQLLLSIYWHTTDLMASTLAAKELENYSPPLPPPLTAASKVQKSKLEK